MIEKMHLRRVDYGELNGKQKEIYNFQKAAAALADYGFNCIKLQDDWEGADFLAYNKKEGKTLKVQLKGRGLTIAQKYLNQDLYLCFGSDAARYLIPHDELVEIIQRVKPKSLQQDSWLKGQQQYYWPQVPKDVANEIERFKLGSASWPSSRSSV